MGIVGGFVMVDWQSIALATLSLLVAAYGYLFYSIVRDQKELEMALQKMQRDHHEHQLNVVRSYASRADLDAAIGKIEHTIENGLRRIERRLDRHSMEDEM